MTEIIQGTPEWFAVRCGKVTASHIADLTAKIKTGESAGRRNYMAQLLAERLTKCVELGIVTSAMKWGIENEALARATYSYEANADIVQVGFVDHPRIRMSGASPDGLVGTNRLVEIKCPNTATHLATWKSRTVPTEYVKQMQWQMACTGREVNDFFSFDPRLPDHLNSVTIPLHRDPRMIVELEAEVIAFIDELDSTVAEMLAPAAREAA